MLWGMETAVRPEPALHPLREHLAAGLKGLHPAYFALVMATGIVSIVSDLLGLREAATFLFWLNVPAYGVLWALFAARALVFPRALAADLASHQRGPGFFTAVAATCVLGLQLLLLRGDAAAALALWWVGMLLWCACTYAVFVVLAVRDPKPTLGEGINGGWLVAVVATQSVVVLGTRTLVPRFPGSEAVLFFLASLWLCGGMLYVWMISLIFYRYMFFRFSPSDLMPPYWINMGAVAISVVAGTSLAAAAPGSAFLGALLPFVKGLTLMFWATATWWIPMLVLLGIWRHGGPSRIRIAYDPLYWGLVFPLGMYALCTYRLGELFAMPVLPWVARAFATVALAAWLLTALGLTGRILQLVVLAVRSLHAERGAAGPQPGSLERMARRS
ncbi:putative membrane protein Rv1735c [Anaeromyxobacter sp. PSR-1]|nr:putative membrane protein Rv1735c [Anaeromyxobacter sp. PSR-1]